MKELVIVAIAAGVGGIVLGKWGGPIEAKLTAAVPSIPPAAIHFVMVGGSATVVYFAIRKVM